MKTSLIALSLLPLSLTLAGAARAQQVRAPAGTLRGATAEGVTSFKGIPYALSLIHISCSTTGPARAS